MSDVQSVAVLKIQSTWRGRFVRKTLKRREIAALQIQRIVRGVLCRFRFSHLLRIHQEKRLQQREHSRRMREISSKETDLKLLSRISPDMYIHFDKLKRANSAKIIQRLWLKKKTPRSMEISSSSEGNQPPSMDEQKLFNSQRTKLKNYILSLDHVVRSVKQEGSHENMNYANPLGLSQLHQRIKMDCQKKAQLHGMKRSAGSRHKYRELLEMQQKAKIYQQEYEELRPYLSAAKEERSNILARMKDNMSYLCHLPNLEEAEKTQAAEKGLYASDFNEEAFLHKLDTSISDHLVALETFESEDWDVVYVPVIGKSSILSSKIPRRKSNSVEDSLLWVTYSNTINPTGQKPRQLQRDLSANVRDPRRHFNNLIQRYNEENEHIEKLSNLVQQSMWRELREKFQVICGDNFKRVKKQGKIQAAVVIQSAIRAYLARKAAAILSDQKKMYHAVQMFIKEISALKHVDDANALQFLLHHNNARASTDDTKFKEALRHSQARQIIQPNRSSQIHATAKLDSDKLFSNDIEAQQEIAAPKYDSPQKAINPHIIASPKVTVDSKSIMPASVSTPVQERTQLLGSSNRTTPKPTGRYSVESRRSQSGEDSSALLSPFLEMPMDNTGSYGGYISPPSQGHTLSRSLSASFGKVFADMDMIEEKEDDVDVYNAILRDLQNGQSPVSQYVDEALVANTGSYDEQAAMTWISHYCRSFDSGSVLRWLSSLHSEPYVELVSTIFLQLHYLQKGKIDKDDMHFFRNFCTMLRFLAADNPSGNVPVVKLHKMFFDRRKE